MLKLYLFMAAIALVLILITTNIAINYDDNDNLLLSENITEKIPTTTSVFDIYGSMKNNISNIELESDNDIFLKQYIVNNEPSNQEILNQQYNKYYWAN